MRFTDSDVVGFEYKSAISSELEPDAEKRAHHDLAETDRPVNRKPSTVNPMDRPLMWFGIALIIVGVLILGTGFLFGHLGRGGRLLPGDIVISKPGFTFAFPIVTSIVLSIVLMLVLWVIASLRR